MDLYHYFEKSKGPLLSLSALPVEEAIAIQDQLISDKNKSNIKKHGVDFKEAETVFQDEMALELFDDEHSDDEDRYIIIGISSKTRELMVCHCYRNDGNVVRIISARRATKNEIALYERR